MERISRAETEASQRKRQVEELKQKAAAGQRKVQARQSEKKKWLAGLRREKEATAQAIDDLKRQAADLQSLLQRLQEEQRQASRARPAAGQAHHARQEKPLEGYSVPPRSMRSWPVQGKLITLFGKQRHRELGTWVFNRGIEIAAAAGSAFRAVAAGRVLFAGPFPKFGNMVVLDHGQDNYTVYAYAGGLGVRRGQSVSAGQQIGQVGESGSLGDPALFFEVTVRGKAVDPLQWLRRK
jgi:septal ring factor EnvC (AmiA/AmiB activator)